MKKFNLKIGLAFILSLYVCVVLIGIIYNTNKGEIVVDFKKGWSIDNKGYSKNDDDVKRLIAVKPSEQQLVFSDMEYYSFIHFGMNTFHDVEWGTGKENPKDFNPEKVDTDQWCEVLKASGSKGIIITAKHHDGFCLWPSEFTEHSIKNSPYMDGKGDIVKQVMESCKKYDMKFGIYLSPWDMNAESYGTDEYNDFYINQLTELCTNYGEVFEYWFDGACGEGPNGKKQVYDFDRYFDLIKELQPNALTAIVGRDVRWIGNEAGETRKSEWSVVSSGNASYEKVAESSQKAADDVSALQSVSSEAKDLGSRELVLKYRDLIWYPAEADTSVNPGWFYHENSYYKKNGQRLKTAKQLAEIYFNTVGGNATLLLNVPPSKNGIIEEREVELLKEFKSIIDEVYKNEIKDFDIFALTADDKRSSSNINSLKTQNGFYALADDEYMLSCSFKSEKKVKTIVIQEDIRHSQRVESFEVYAHTSGEKYKNIAKNTVIGSKRIIRLKKPISTNEIRFVFTQSRSNPIIRSIAFYS